MGKSRIVKSLCLPPALQLTREERRRILFAPISIQVVGGKSWGGAITQQDTWLPGNRHSGAGQGDDVTSDYEREK